MPTIPKSLQTQKGNKMEITIDNVRFLAFSASCAELYAKMDDSAKLKTGSNFNQIEFYVSKEEYRDIKSQIEKIKLSCSSKKQKLVSFHDKYYFENCRRGEDHSHFLVKIQPARISGKELKTLKEQIRYHQTCINEIWAKIHNRS